MFAASTLLFVPGSRPDRFAKARAAGADVTVIDLEDAVAQADKQGARRAALAEVAKGGAWALRINGIATGHGMADLLALHESEDLPAYLLISMVQEARDLEIVSEVLGERCPRLVPLIETPRGLRHALAIAQVPGVAAMMFGGGDFAGELKVAMAWEPLQAARQQLILACAEAGVPAVDVPFTRLDDDPGLAEECAWSRALGFSAKAAIHPGQLSAIREAFLPSGAEVAEAEDALQAYSEAGGKALRHNGRLLEAPLIGHYREIVARSRRQADA